MSVRIGVDPQASTLFTAIGLTDADGQLVAAWFDDPIGAARTILSDPVQRAALLSLLDDLLPAGDGAPGWHPLLDHDLGNVYLTVGNDVIGVAAAMRSPEGVEPQVRGSVVLPLVDVAGELRAVAGSPEGPVQVGVDVTFTDPAVPLTGASAHLTIDVDRGAGVVVRLTGLDLGGGPVDLVVDSSDLRADLVDALRLLLREALESLAGGDERIARLAAHLFALLGLGAGNGTGNGPGSAAGAIPPLPLDRILADPAVVREWLTDIADAPATLAPWATHLAGLLGDDLPVTGTGTSADPVRAPLVALGVVDLDLLVGVSSDGQLLDIGLSIGVDTPVAALAADVVVLRVPLHDPTRPAEVVPAVEVVLRAPAAGMLAADAPALQVGAVRAGFRLAHGQVQPWLALTDVVLDGVAHGTVDLTDADAVANVVADQLENLLADAFGAGPQAHALLALVGLQPPATDPASPHRVSIADLGRRPTAALSAFHRAVLADAAHPWSHLLAEIAVLLGLPSDVEGAGTAADPWRVRLAEAGAAGLDLAAWNASDGATPDGEQRLRLGLLARAEVGPFRTSWLGEVLSMDLPAGGEAAVGVLGVQTLDLACGPLGPVTTPVGLAAGAERAVASARWRPGGPFGWTMRVEDIVLRAADDSYGPVTWTFPGTAAGLDLAGTALGMLRRLLSQALYAWAGDAAYVVAGLLGLHRDLPALPVDWPLLGGSADGPADLLADPAGVLRDQVERLLTETSAQGRPHAQTALRLVGALLRSWSAPAGTRPDVDVTVTGSGTHADPWAVPLPTTAGESADLLTWLEPAGPPAAWIGALMARLPEVRTAAHLRDLLAQAAAFHPALRELLAGRTGISAAIETLRAWLAGSDGVVPLASQLPTGATWQHGTTLTTPHAVLPRDPSAIAQVRTRIAAWAGSAPRATVLVAPFFADRTLWAPMLAAIDLGHPAEAHFDLRSLPDPAEVDLGRVTAVASTYTADLLAGAGLSEVDQLERVVRRVIALTGVPAVTLVAHSTAGVTARALAARTPAIVRGLVTLGTPHAGSPLTPLTDDGVAAAVRVLAAIAGPVADTALGATLTQLAATLDGVAGPLGGPLDPAAFAGAAGGLVDAVPGFALGSALSGDLVGLLSGALVADLPGQGQEPSHLAVGVRLRLDVPAAAAGEVAVTARARVDLTRVRLRPDAAEPDRPATAVAVDLQAARPGGWLVGAESASAGPRVRWLEAGVTVRPDGAGSVTATPRLVLHEAGRGVAAARVLRLADVLDPLAAPDLRGALDGVLAQLQDAAAGTAAAALRDLLGAGGAVVQTADGPRASIAGLTELAQAPSRALAAARPALLDALRRAIGRPPGPIAVSLASFPLELAYDPAAGTVRLRTTRDVSLAEPLVARLDVRFDAASLAHRAEAALVAGSFALTCDAAGVAAVQAPPWLGRLALRPFDLAATQRYLGDALPRLAVSAAVTALLGDRVAGAIGPVDAFLADPGGWLRRADALGSGGHLDGTKLNGLLQTAAAALGLDASQGMELPGGFLLRASGSDPARLAIAGTFGDPAVATLGLDLALDVHRDGRVTPAGTVTVGVEPGGTWGRIEVAFSLDATGVGLVVTPENGPPIRLLPTVDGVGALAAGATQLLPHLLQELVTWLKAQPGAHDVLDVALRLATALGLYSDDAAGFTDPVRAARLRAMLQPGWLEAEVADSGAVAGILVQLFGASPKIPLPAGHRIERVEDRIRWVMDVFPGCSASAELGWSAGGVPQVAIGITGLDTGPVTVLEARLGLDSGRLRLRVEPGGELDFFAPELELDLDLAGGGPAVRILPLGAARAVDCAVTITPTPQVTFTADGALAVVGDWLVPLLARFLLPGVTDLLDDPLWSGGPTARAVLLGAGLIKDTPSAPPVVAHPVPALPAVGLGALAALANNATVHVTDTLDLTAVAEMGRLGLRLHGRVEIPLEDVHVSVRFGSADWLDAAPGAGITVWLLRADATATPPFLIDPALTVGGLGVVLGGPKNAPLVEGAVEVGALGALVFLEARFIEGGKFVVKVDHVGGAVEVADARVALDSGDGDAFVAKVLPPALAAPFSVALAVRDGAVEVHGGIGNAVDGVELAFPLDLDLFGVVFLRELLLAAAFRDGRAEAIAAISGNAALGPLAMTVTRVGLRLAATGSGVQLGFKAPDGFGLSLDASVIRAGGFLLVDEARGRYVGAIELSILQKFDLSAVGIVTTKRPDGSPGFSLLLLVTATLPVPIPLGYGFFFAGAGGLIGLNRGMDLDRIRDGLRAGTADSILFPTDIIRRIDVIVRDLEESFPVSEGRFLVAPMAFIQWMNPALVTVKLGLVIEIAAPPRFALLGVLRLALPTPDEAVVDLKVAFLGSIDLAAGLLSFDAAIYDSYIGYGDFRLSLEGDIAIRISWGASPDLVASVGGFHPAYRPAAHLRLPAMRRITLSLLKDNPRITLRLYFAVTTNTVQFGAQLDLYVGVSGFSITGTMGFDVLVQIAPFLIDAHMWARLAVRAGGSDVCSISLDLRLRGPTPWVARGKATFKILFISVSVELEARFGDERATTLPAEPVLAKLLDALRDPKAWAAELSTDATSHVVLEPPPAGTLVVDAAGLLAVRQNLIPLATDIRLVGAVPPADIRRASITRMRFGTGAGAQVVPHADVLAPFAPSTFAGTSTADADRLKAPAFEQRPHGVQALSGTALAAGAVVAHAVAYERVVVDDPDATAPPPLRSNPPVAVQRLVAGGAAGSSVAARKRHVAAERGVVLDAVEAEPRYAVTGLGDLRALSGAGTPVPRTDPQWRDAALLRLADAEHRLATLAAAGLTCQVVPEVQVV